MITKTFFYKLVKTLEKTRAMTKLHSMDIKYMQMIPYM